MGPVMPTEFLVSASRILCLTECCLKELKILKIQLKIIKDNYRYVIKDNWPKNDLIHRPYLIKETTRGEGVKNCLF